MDKSWVPTLVFLVVSVGAVALLTRIAIWLVYCFKAAPNRSGAEEMELAEKADRERDLQDGKLTYTSYEQWRKDILSDKPLNEIVGRVPPGFFDKKPEPVVARGPQGEVTINYEIKGALGPQGAVLSGPAVDGAKMARQRLAEMHVRMAAEQDKGVKARLEEIRQRMLVPSSPVVQNTYLPVANVAKPYCHHCKGTGYHTVINLNGIPTSGVRCAWCNN